MPTISMFYGIIIQMFSEKGSKHHLPHIHAIFGEYEIVITFDGTVLQGSLPSNKMKLLIAWMELHNDELHANWKLMLDGEPFFRIDPLK